MRRRSNDAAIDERGVAEFLDERALVVEVAPSVNLVSLTIEQVIGKRLKLLSDMGAGMGLEVQGQTGKLEPDEAEAQLARLAKYYKLQPRDDMVHAFRCALRATLDTKRQTTVHREH